MKALLVEGLASQAGPLAIAAGVMFAAGIYLLLARDRLRLVLGLGMLGNAINLSILVAGRLSSGPPPLVPPGASAPPAAVASPLPQALILTAIVIGLGLMVFTLAMFASRGSDGQGEADR